MREVVLRRDQSTKVIHRSGVAPILLACIMLLASVLPGPAAAQQPEAAQFSPEQLQAFAAASRSVDQLNNKWIPQIAETGSAREKERLRSQALAEMKEAVRDEGLSVDEYNSIYDAAERDPELSEIIDEHKRELPR
jgi:hypothetical protein